MKKKSVSIETLFSMSSGNGPDKTFLISSGKMYIYLSEHAIMRVRSAKNLCVFDPQNKFKEFAAGSQKGYQRGLPSMNG